MAKRVPLVHTYQARELFDGSVRPSQRAMMQIAAVWCLENEGLIDGSFMSGAKLWGGNHRAFAMMMADEARNIGVEKPIFIKPAALTTHKEIDLYLEEARIRGWQPLIFLANRIHLERVKQILRSRKVEGYTLIATEDVLQRFPFFKDYLKEFANSTMENNFKEREKMAIIAYRLGLESVLTIVAAISRKKPFYVNFDA